MNMMPGLTPSASSDNRLKKYWRPALIPRRILEEARRERSDDAYKDFLTDMAELFHDTGRAADVADDFLTLAHAITLIAERESTCSLVLLGVAPAANDDRQIADAAGRERADRICTRVGITWVHEPTNPDDFSVLAGTDDEMLQDELSLELALPAERCLELWRKFADGRSYPYKLLGDVLIIGITGDELDADVSAP